MPRLTIKALFYITYISTRLKLRLSSAIHNFKWIKLSYAQFKSKYMQI